MPKTWGEAIAACFGDENADGVLDVDIDTLVETGLFTGLDYFGQQTAPENTMNARNNALIRVETASVIQKLNIFPPR